MPMLLEQYAPIVIFMALSAIIAGAFLIRLLALRHAWTAPTARGLTV